MELTATKQSEGLLIRVSGRLDAATAPDFEAGCLAHARQGESRLLLDFSGVEYISSAGLRALLVIAKALKTAGGALALFGLQPMVQEVMTISGFDQILPIAPDRAAAIQRLA